MSLTVIIALGCFGGLLPDILRLIKDRYNSALPTYLRSGMFWLGLFLLVVIGGVTAWLLGAQDAKQAVAYGFAAPELLSRLASKVPEPQFRTRGATFDLRTWWGI
jgi:hypothetical protein